MSKAIHRFLFEISVGLIKRINCCRIRIPPYHRVLQTNLNYCRFNLQFPFRWNRSFMQLTIPLILLLIIRFNVMVIVLATRQNDCFYTIRRVLIGQWPFHLGTIKKQILVFRFK